MILSSSGHEVQLTEGKGRSLIGRLHKYRIKNVYFSKTEAVRKIYISFSDNKLNFVYNKIFLKSDQIKRPWFSIILLKRLWKSFQSYLIYTVTLSHCGLDPTVKEKRLPELQRIFSSRLTDVSHTVEQTQKTLQALKNHLKHRETICYVFQDYLKKMWVMIRICHHFFM